MAADHPCPRWPRAPSRSCASSMARAISFGMSGPNPNFSHEGGDRRGSIPPSARWICGRAAPGARVESKELLERMKGLGMHEGWSQSLDKMADTLAVIKR